MREQTGYRLYGDPVCTHRYTSIYVYTIYIHINTHIYIYTCTYIYIYTHTHTHGTHVHYTYKARNTHQRIMPRVLCGYRTKLCTAAVYRGGGERERERKKIKTTQFFWEAIGITLGIFFHKKRAICVNSYYISKSIKNTTNRFKTITIEMRIYI